MIYLVEVGGKMLFDERDLRVFDNSDSANLFIISETSSPIFSPDKTFPLFNPIL